jgi:cytochrome c oxidase subunit II
MKRTFTSKGLFIVLCLTASALAKDAPITNWLQQPATPLAGDVRGDFWLTFLLVSPFLLLPQILLVYSIWKFSEKRGHKPATFHENLKLEVLWTVVPVITLICIAVPTYHTLRKMDVPPKSDLVVEVIGHQFFWEYRYPRYGIGFANEPLVVPAEKVVTINTTSVDVIHSFWVPAFGIKQDANPGRITHTWFKARPGKYKGQCAELCGALHGEMFINVTVLPEDEWEAWLSEKAPSDTTAVTPETPTPKSTRTSANLPVAMKVEDK